MTHVHIKEQMIHASPRFEQPHYDMHERIPGGAPYGYNAAARMGRRLYRPPGYCPPGQPGFVPPAQQ